jgi:FtsZ-interacting cell division protein ZipA
LKTLIEIRQDELNPKEILVPEIAKKAPTMLFKKRLDEDDDEPLLDELEQEKEPQKPRKESEPFDEKEWITEFEKMTLNQEEKLQQYYSSKKQELQQEKERLNAEKQKLLNERKGTDKVVLNVGGREFHVSVSNFASHKECILNQIFLLGVQGMLIRCD